MALNIEGQKCPICNSYLFPEDDVVFCPTCGAPHHRDCFNSVGHCGLEHTHGTDEQYDRFKQAEEHKDHENENNTKKAEICPNCKNKLSDDMLVCPYCGRPRHVRVFSLDLLGGVAPDTDLGDGVTASEARDFVQINTQRYIPKFQELRRKRFSWNWAALLFPHGWFLSRKMYKIGSFFIALSVAAQVCYIPLLNALNTAVFSTSEEYVNYFLQNIDKFGAAPILLTFLGSAITVIASITAAVLGDSLYKKHAIRKIKELRNSDEKDIKLRKFGGVNIFAFIIGVLITTYLPEIISMFI